MTEDAIKEHAHAAPFQPLDVHQPDRRTYLVPAPDYASVSPNGRLLTVYTDEGNDVRVLDVARITEVISNAENQWVVHGT